MGNLFCQLELNLNLNLLLLVLNGTHFRYLFFIQYINVTYVRTISLSLLHIGTSTIQLVNIPPAGIYIKSLYA